MLGIQRLFYQIGILSDVTDFYWKLDMTRLSKGSFIISHISKYTVVVNQSQYPGITLLKNLKFRETHKIISISALFSETGT